MPAKATIRDAYRWRLGIIALGLLGFAAYCFYDGYIAYPHYKEQWDTYQTVKADYPETYTEEWKRVAADRGWSAKRPSKTSDWDITTQYLMGAGSLLVGVPFLFGFLRTYTRWVASDEAGLRASGSKVAPWDSITRLDSTRWKTKGIAFVHYDRDGKEGRILLDDWKFERDPTVQIYDEVREHLGLAEGDEAEIESASTEADGEPMEPQASAADDGHAQTFDDSATPR